VVRRLVGLKARLLWNGARHDLQRRFGLPVAAIGLTWLALWLARKHLSALDALAGDQAAWEHYLGWAALFLYLAWVSLPVVIFPLDENLDPQQLAALPVSRTEIVTGLTAASFVAPATIAPIILLSANGARLAAGWWMAVPASLLFMVMLSIGGQLFSTAMSAILRTRRGRDIATFLILGMAAGSFFLYRAVAEKIDSFGLAEAAVSLPILSWAPFLPPVAAQRAVVEAAAGEPAAALAFLAAAALGTAAMAVGLRSLLGWMLTTPQEGGKPASRARRSGMAEGLWGVIPTLARKELRFYVRDPRQRLVWTGTVIFVGLAAAGSIMEVTGLFDVRGADWAPLAAPILVMFVGLPIALNLFGWERNAASYLFVLPVAPRRLLAGKNVAVSIGLMLEALVIAVALSFFSGFWKWTWMVLPLMVAAVGSQLAVGNMVSVLAPLRLPREGTDVFAQSTEQGCLAIASQLVSFFIIGLLLVPPASIVVLTVDFGRPVPPWLTACFAVAYGLIVYGASLFVSSRILKRRLPEVMAWVQVV